MISAKPGGTFESRCEGFRIGFVRHSPSVARQPDTGARVNALSCHYWGGRWRSQGCHEIIERMYVIRTGTLIWRRL